MEEGLSLDDAREGGHSESGIKSMEFKPFINYRLRGESGRYTKLQVTISPG